MAGIYGTYRESGELPERGYTRMFSSSREENLNEEMRWKRFVGGRSVVRRFLDDRVLKETPDYLLAFEGVMYDAGEQGSGERLIEAYESDPERFPERLEGLFSGFLLDKRRRTLCLFTDPLSTKPLYWQADPGTGSLTFASELKAVTALCREAGVSLQPSADAFRCLLSFGYMLDDLTPAREVRKVPPGSVMRFNLETLSQETLRWFDLRGETADITMAEAVEETDRLLRKAVEREWEKDRRYNYGHAALLSGGLDSRVNVLLADELGYGPIRTLTFSREGTSDERIAREIAEDRGFRHRFVDLGDGSYLADDPLRYVRANDGVTAFNGAAHMLHALEKTDLSSCGGLHSGQIGDVLFGSFAGLASKLRGRPGSLGFLDAPEIIERIGIWPEVRGRYLDGNPELFAWEQRQINGTLNGDRSVAHRIDMPSPFYDRELIRFCLSLPEEFRRGEKLYAEWMRQRHPGMAAYRWQKSGTSLRSPLLLKFSSVAAKAGRRLAERLGLPGDRMTPLAWWYGKNPRLREVLNARFNAHIGEVEEPELRALFRKVYRRNEAQAKCNALTAVLSYTLHLKS